MFHRQFALQGERAGLDVVLDPAALAESQVFHDGELSDGEAVMYLGDADLLARVFDAGLPVGGVAGADVSSTWARSYLGSYTPPVLPDKSGRT